MEPGEDEAAKPVADEKWMLTRCEAHLRLGRCAHTLHAPALCGHDLLDRGGRVDRDGHDPRRLPHRERDERGEEMHVVDHTSTVIDYEDLLAARVDDHAQRRAERRHEYRELALLLLELFERARSDVLRYDAVHRDGLNAQCVEKLRQELRGGAV